MFTLHYSRPSRNRAFLGIILLILLLAPVFRPEPVHSSTAEMPPQVVTGITVQEEAKLIASDAATGNSFGLGHSVSLSFDTALVGTRSEAAYIFADDGSGNWTNWTEEAKLTATSELELSPLDFGFSVALSGDTALVGAPMTDWNDPINGTVFGVGAIYASLDDGFGNWSSASVAGFGAAELDSFGVSVSYDGVTELIGAPGVDTPTLMDAGAAYANGSELTADDAAEYAGFGFSVSAWGPLALVGTFDSAYIFIDDGIGGWAQKAKLLPNDNPAGFGQSVALGLPGIALVGADDAVYVFADDGFGFWSQQDKLVGDDTVPGDGFGFSISLFNEIAVIGAPWAEHSGKVGAGAAYVFSYDFDLGTWTQQAKLTATDANSDDQFGNSVAVSISLDGYAAVVGAPGADHSGQLDPGAAYVFSLTPDLPPEPPMIVTNDPLLVVEGTKEFITNSYLWTDDSDTTPEGLIYTLGGQPSHGEIQVFNIADTVFTQADINAGQVSYIHNGDEPLPTDPDDSFNFTVTDGVYSDSGTFNINVVPDNDPPTIINNSVLTLGEGARSVISSSHLLTDDPDNTPSELVYTIGSWPAYGTFYLNDVEYFGNVFTQADIDAGLVSYGHNGDEPLPTDPDDSFDFTVSDWVGSATGGTFNIVVTAVNDPPVLQSNSGLWVGQGETKTINSAYLWADDEDNPWEDLTYVITSLPVHGSLKLNDVALLQDESFTQGEMNYGNFSYTHDNGQTTADSFEFVLSDGVNALPPETFNITIISTGCKNLTTITLAECEALVTFYHSTGGPNWTSNNGWLSDGVDPCTWVGITCTNGHVERIALNNYNLVGTIPAQIGDLGWLRELILNINQLSGSIPAEIGNLSSLERLDLSNNVLSGSIPTQIGTLTGLTYLSLFGNQLSGTIPPQIGALINLQTLSLGVNQLDGQIPPAIGNIDNPQNAGDTVKLTSLSLGYNALIGDIPLEITNFTDLTFLNLSNNRLIANDQNVLNYLQNLNNALVNEQTLPPRKAPSIELSRVLQGRNLQAWAARINWDLIDYTDDPGYYRVLVSEDSATFDTVNADPDIALPTGVIEACQSDSKADNDCVTPELIVGTTYYFVVQTFTASHVGTGGEQQNDLYSTLSPILTLTVPPEPNLPGEFVSPSGLIEEGLGNPVFIWASVPTATQYDFYLGHVTGTDTWDTIVYETGLEATSICAGDLCYLDPIDISAGYGLLDGDYTAFMNAYDANGNTLLGTVENLSGWVRHDFTVDLPNAALPVVAINPGDGRIAVQWPDDTNTLWVQIWAGSHPSGNYFQWHGRDTGEKQFTCDGTICVAYPAWDVPSATNLTMWMQAWRPGGFSEGGTAEPLAPSWNQMSARVDGAGVETPATTFDLPADTPAAPTNIGMVDATVADPVVTWTGSAGTTWYNVVVYDPASSAIPVNEWFVYQDADLNCLGRLTDPADYDCALGGLGLNSLLTSGITYQIWMRSWGPGGFGTGATDLAPNWNKGEFTYSPA